MWSSKFRRATDRVNRMPSRARSLTFVVPIIVTVALVSGPVMTGCGSSSPPSTSTVRGTITVSAASSLTQAFAKIGSDFEAAHIGTSVSFNFGPSSTLKTQIVQGAPADVFAAADSETMGALRAAGLLRGQSPVFAKNRLVIVTKPGNPYHLRTLDDLATVGTVSLCGLEVPCGKYAAQALHASGVTIAETNITRGADAKATLAAVSTGDADAAIVYATDARSAGRSVTSVTIRDSANATTVYLIAVVKTSESPKAAKAFIDYLGSAPGQASLRSFGFLPPS